jgi:hypothetical protein
MSSLNTPPVIAGVTSLAISKWLTFVAALLLLVPFTAEAIPAAALADTAKMDEVCSYPWLRDKMGFTYRSH